MAASLQRLNLRMSNSSKQTDTFAMEFRGLSAVGVGDFRELSRISCIITEVALLAIEAQRSDGYLQRHNAMEFWGT